MAGAFIVGMVLCLAVGFLAAVVSVPMLVPEWTKPRRGEGLNSETQRN